MTTYLTDPIKLRKIRLPKLTKNLFQNIASPTFDCYVEKLGVMDLKTLEVNKENIIAMVTNMDWDNAREVRLNS